MCERETAVGTIDVANKLLEAKRIAPESDYHQAALAALVELLANTPGAIAELKKQQNGNSGVGEH